MKVRLRLRGKTVGRFSCDTPVVRLRVRAKHGRLAELDFRVDTQADFTSIPVAEALERGIPFSQEHQRTVVGLVGETTTYLDAVRVMIAGREHIWPCYFVKLPAPREPSRRPRELLPVLGRAGFLDDYAIAIDSGFLIITRIGPVRRWWRRLRKWIWTCCGLIHPEGRAL